VNWAHVFPLSERMLVISMSNFAPLIFDVRTLHDSHFCVLHLLFSEHSPILLRFNKLKSIIMTVRIIFDYSII